MTVAAVLTASYQFSLIPADGRRSRTGGLWPDARIAHRDRDGLGGAMSSAECRKASGPWTGWWTAAARALALVLSIALALPTAGLVEDLAYHRGRERTGSVVTSDVVPVPAETADPGLACHVHCGCHAAMPLDGSAAAAPVGPSRPCYARVEAALSSIFPDRPPRPPRA